MPTGQRRNDLLEFRVCILNMKNKGFGVNGGINRHLEFRAHMYLFKICLLKDEPDEDIVCYCF